MLPHHIIPIRGDQMSRKARTKSRNGIYHIIQRGANRQDIFHDEEDRIRYLEILLKYKMMVEIKIYAWCLMDNHVHLLVAEGNEEISVTMKRIGVSYAWYYNCKYKTSGHLYQDRFRSENVETLRYFLRVTRYIHQNPLKAGIVKRVDEWKWSSCMEYYGGKNYPKNLLDKNYILHLYSPDITVAINRFKEFNERQSNAKCLDDTVLIRVTLSDEEARKLIKRVLGNIEIAQVKSMPKANRDEVLRKVKGIKGISQRQAARIFGVSANLIFKA